MGGTLMVQGSVSAEGLATGGSLTRAGCVLSESGGAAVDEKWARGAARTRGVEVAGRAALGMVRAARVRSMVLGVLGWSSEEEESERASGEVMKSLFPAALCIAPARCYDEGPSSTQSSTRPRPTPPYPSPRRPRRPPPRLARLIIATTSSLGTAPPAVELASDSSDSHLAVHLHRRRLVPVVRHSDPAYPHPALPLLRLAPPSTTARHHLLRPFRPRANVRRRRRHPQALVPPAPAKGSPRHVLGQGRG